ncbi:hypothetical protein P879_11857, partial [Paragonimus westermani]
VRIRVCPLSWPAVHQLACEARDDGHLDVYYVFKQLCVANAFAFCATRQALYPGAPLFDSPRYKYDASSAPRGRRNVVASYLPLIKPPNSCFSDQSEALECLDTSLKQYTDSKRLLNQLKPPSKDTAATEPVEYDERDEFLPGLNFITYPVSGVFFSWLVMCSFIVCSLSCQNVCLFFRRSIRPVELASQFSLSDNQLCGCSLGVSLFYFPVTMSTTE